MCWRRNRRSLHERLLERGERGAPQPERAAKGEQERAPGESRGHGPPPHSCCSSPPCSSGLLRGGRGSSGDPCIGVRRLVSPGIEEAPRAGEDQHRSRSLPRVAGYLRCALCARCHRRVLSRGPRSARRRLGDLRCALARESPISSTARKSDVRSLTERSHAARQWIKPDSASPDPVQARPCAGGLPLAVSVLGFYFQQD